MDDSFKLTNNPSQKVSLGCGTLILIALIVLIFSQEGSRDVKRELRDLKDDIRQLKQAVDQQNDELRKIQRSLPPPRAEAADF